MLLSFYFLFTGSKIMRKLYAIMKSMLIRYVVVGS